MSRHLRNGLLSASAVLLAVHVLNAGCADDTELSNPSSAAGMGAAGMSGAPPAGAGGAAGQSAAAPAKLSFATDVYDQVIRAKCFACHTDAPSFGGLALFPGAATAYANLVGVPAGAAEDNRCKDSGLMRVQPGEPERSLIYLKLTMPSCGGYMPPAAFGQTTQAQVKLIRQWIAEGAAP